MDSHPGLMYRRVLATTSVGIHMRVDKPPFDDINVRKAMHLAINNQEIADSYFMGNAEIMSWPLGPVEEYGLAYTPVEELPPETAEQFTYNPEKAKQLLEEAGYPDGFRTSINCWEDMVEELEIAKAYFSDIGVEMEIQVAEYGTWMSKNYSGDYEMASYGVGYGTAFQHIYTETGSKYNFSLLSNPDIDRLIELTRTKYWDYETRYGYLKEATLVKLAEFAIIQLPTEYGYTIWQPRIKGYSGEYSTGKKQYNRWLDYVWVDQDVELITSQ